MRILWVGDGDGFGLAADGGGDGPGPDGRVGAGVLVFADARADSEGRAGWRRDGDDGFVAVGWNAFGRVGAAGEIDWRFDAVEVAEADGCPRGAVAADKREDLDFGFEIEGIEARETGDENIEAGGVGPVLAGV